MKTRALVARVKSRLSDRFISCFWFAVALALIGYGLRENVNLYVSVGELHKRQSKYADEHFRLGGYVKEGSIKRHHSSIEFVVTEHEGKVSKKDPEIKVRFSGILPSLFKEGKAMVADGRMIKGVFYASEVLAKHDENYQVPK